MMLEIAKGFSRMYNKPPRSILFLAVTAEEKGLLGAKYYAENPLVPLESTLADINMDVINLWGRTRDMTSVGMGNSTLDDLLERRRQGQGPHRRAATPSPRRARSTAPTTSSSPSRASPRSTPRAASTTSASPPATAWRSATSTPRTTTTSRATR